MLELRQKPSELSDFENRSQNLISHTLKNADTEDYHIEFHHIFFKFFKF